MARSSSNNTPSRLPKTTPRVGMFHRRLVLLAAGAIVAFVAIALQASRVTVLEGASWLDAAERRLFVERWMPTTRGRILDRKGRVLAQDEAAFDVMVDYAVITGDWAEREATRRARRANRSEWPKLGRADRRALVDQYLPEYEAELLAMWSELAVALDTPLAELEDRKNEVKRRVQSMAEYLWQLWRDEREEELSRDGEDADVELADVSKPIREQTMAHAIASGVDEDVAFEVRRLAQRYPGLEVRATGVRGYPLESQMVEVDLSTFPPPLRQERTIAVETRGVATGIVGWMRELDRVGEGQPLDTERRPMFDVATGELDRGYYKEGDRVGGAGFESSREDVLRGLRGYERESLETGAVEREPFQQGGDVHLTLDARLQAEIQALLDPALGLAMVQPWHHASATDEEPHPFPLEDGTALSAAAVVIEVATGDIVALVSTPSFSREDLQKRPQWVFGDPIDRPFYNRACGSQCQPGSIVKPLVLCSAITSSAMHMEDHVECNGHFLPNAPGMLRCWIFRDHTGFATHEQMFGHALSGAEAIGASCNIYFYTCGKQLGVDGLKLWYERFGVGQPLNLGIGGEWDGSVGKMFDGSTPGTGDAIQMGIGQGPVSWTPLHAADSLATIARRGVRIAPRLDRDQTPRAEDLELDQSAVNEALEGLRCSFEEPWGTGHMMSYGAERVRICAVDGLHIIGKTGTATASPIVDPDTKEVLRRGDHAWFAGLVGPSRDELKYAIAVMVEYGGSGGRVSGPIAEQIIRMLQREGYL